jgi:hypothetical protein
VLGLLAVTFHFVVVVKPEAVSSETIGLNIHAVEERRRDP